MKARIPLFFKYLPVLTTLQKLIEKMMEKNEDLRRNAKIALATVADLPEGFLKITEQMAGKVDLMDDLFGAGAVKALAELLPSVASLGENPFRIDPNKLAKYQVFYYIYEIIVVCEVSRTLYEEV